ncbi:unnamed protein product [Somion occarium]|uniref:Uncharacterized protein n=1 Tax=Somion occarium TaxID=3059160 RepID=A0ABP1E133_9APHY
MQGTIGVNCHEKCTVHSFNTTSSFKLYIIAESAVARWHMDVSGSSKYPCDGRLSLIMSYYRTCESCIAPTRIRVPLGFHITQPYTNQRFKTMSNPAPSPSPSSSTISLLSTTTNASTATLIPKKYPQTSTPMAPTASSGTLSSTSSSSSSSSSSSAATIVARAPPKDYEASFGMLASTMGFSGTTPVKIPKKNKTKSSKNGSGRSEEKSKDPKSTK